jgi:hypothetical protein
MAVPYLFAPAVPFVPAQELDDNFAYIVSGNPIISGNPIFSGNPVFTGTPTFASGFPVPVLSSAPSSPINGSLYYDTAIGALRLYTGSIWLNMLSA